ncbi:MAG: PfkB family carbohydrate kinase [Chloroflexota bacterium]
MSLVDYLVIGHVAKDIVPAGHALGGTVTFAALTAQRLGLRAAIVTAADEAIAAEAQAALPGIAIHVCSSVQTTTFENIYTDAGRTQYLRAHAEHIALDDVPTEWRDARIVHLGPIAQEFDSDLVHHFPHSLIALTPQGWMRQWDASGRVSPKVWSDALDVLRAVDVLIFSPEDVGHDWNVIHAYTRAAPLAVLTLERHGALVFQRDEGRWLAPRDAQVVDPTGAGDVFAAAFLTVYSESGDPLRAARFANVAASFSTEKGGLAAVPDRATVMTWFESRPKFHGDVLHT